MSVFSIAHLNECFLWHLIEATFVPDNSNTRLLQMNKRRDNWQATQLFTSFSSLLRNQAIQTLIFIKTTLFYSRDWHWTRKINMWDWGWTSIHITIEIEKLGIVGRHSTAETSIECMRETRKLWPSISTLSASEKLARVRFKFGLDYQSGEKSCSQASMKAPEETIYTATCPIKFYVVAPSLPS